MISIRRTGAALLLLLGSTFGDGSVVVRAADPATPKKCTPSHEDRTVDWRVRRTDMQVSGADYCEESEVRIVTAKDTRCGTPAIVRCTLTGKKTIKRGHCASRIDPCEHYE